MDTRALLPGNLGTSRAIQSVTRSVGLRGRIVAATIIHSAGTTQRGQLQVYAAIYKGLAGNSNFKYQLLEDYLYDDFTPQGWGSLPVEPGDLIQLAVANSAASIGVFLRLVISTTERGASSWNTARDPHSKRGTVRTVTGTNPDAGAEIAETVPTGARWKLLGFTVVLVAAAGGSARTPYLIADDGTTANRRWFLGAASAISEAAGETRTWVFMEGTPLSLDAAYETLTDTDTLLTGGYFPPTILNAGDRIRTVTVNLAGGDDYAAPIFQVEELIEQ